MPRHAPQREENLHVIKTAVTEEVESVHNSVTSPQDRWQGMLGATAILNHACKAEPHMRPACIHDAPLRGGFFGSPPDRHELAAACAGRLFLSFDDKAFGRALQEFLKRRFPDRCKYEVDGS